MIIYDPRHNSPQHRRNARRRLYKRIGQVSYILGALCLLFSMAMIIGAFVSEAHKLGKLGVIYISAGIALLLLGFFMDWLREGRSRRRRRSRGEGSERLGSGPQSGMALVLVLAILGILSAWILMAQVSARNRMKLGEARLQAALLEQASLDAMKVALQRLADDVDLAVDHLSDSWSKRLEELRPDGITTLTLVKDLNRYWDLNNLRVESVDADAKRADTVLIDIMTLCGDFNSVDKVDALSDWLDGDEDGLKELDYYESSERVSRPRNSWLRSSSEILSVDGFDRDAFREKERFDRRRGFNASLPNCVTTVPGARTRFNVVNVNTAPIEVLTGLLGFENEALVETILEQRRIRPIRSLGDVRTDDAGRAVLESMSSKLGTASSFFKIRSIAHSENSSRWMEAIVLRNHSGVTRVLQLIR